MKKFIAAVLLLTMFSNVSFTKNWWKDAVFYEIFIRSFYDANGDGKGDIQGLIAKLDYLNDGDPKTSSDLGIDAIWLMPAFDSPSYHGYDTIDYYKIEPDYGNNADFDLLIQEAHKRGIKIILDLVINHTSSQIEWFKKSVKKEAPYTDYYVWSPTIPDGGWGKPWGGGGASTVWSYSSARKEYYYSVFWNGMPDLNFQNPDVTKEIYKIAEYWIKKGVDGFRLDAARYLVETGPGAGQNDTAETLKWWADFNKFVKKVNPDTMLVGETWERNEIVAKYYDGGKGLDLCFDFNLASFILNSVTGKSADKIAASFNEKKKLGAPFGFYAPFLSNHDQMRSMNMIMKNIDRAKLAAVLLLTMPGTPFIYYGEEIGMIQDNGSSDEKKRTPMQWNDKENAGFTTGKPWYSPYDYSGMFNVEAQQKEKDSLWNLYRMMIALRKANPELSGLDIEFADAGDKSLALYYRGNVKNKKIVVLINLSDEQKTANIPYIKGKKYTDLMTGKQEKSADGKISLEAKSFILMKETK
jgi:glycosidase